MAAPDPKNAFLRHWQQASDIYTVALLSKLACFALRGCGLFSASLFAASGTRVRRARMVDEAARFAEWTKEGPSV